MELRHNSLFSHFAFSIFNHDSELNLYSLNKCDFMISLLLSKYILTMQSLLSTELLWDHYKKILLLRQRIGPISQSIVNGSEGF